MPRSTQRSYAKKKLQPFRSHLARPSLQLATHFLLALVLNVGTCTEEPFDVFYARVSDCSERKTCIRITGLKNYLNGRYCYFGENRYPGTLPRAVLSMRCFCYEREAREASREKLIQEFWVWLPGSCAPIPDVRRLGLPEGRHHKLRELLVPPSRSQLGEV